MTRWGAQLPMDGSENTGSTGFDGSEDGDEPTIDRAQLAAARAGSESAQRDDPPTDDDATISRDALEQLRAARRHVHGDEAATVSRAELNRHRAADGTAARGPLRRDLRAAADVSSPPAESPGDYFRDAHTIPYATLMSLRAGAGTASAEGDSVLVPRDATRADVRAGDENVATQTIRLPLPAAELAREADEGDDEDEIPEETLPTPVTHEVAVSTRGGQSQTGAPRPGTRTQARANGPAPAVPIGPHRTAGLPLARARHWIAGAPRRIVVLWIAAVLAAVIALAVALVSQVGPAAAGLGAGRGETNILVALAASPKDATDIALDGGADAVTIAVVDFSADGSSVSVVSLRPDIWVAIPDHGEGTLSDALTLGGAATLRTTVQESLGVRIDHTVVISEPGLTGLAASGDLGIVNPSEVTTERFTFPSGPLVLSPSTAVDFLASDPRDLTRQQAVLDGAARLVLDGGASEDAALDDGLAVLPELADDARERLLAQLRTVGANGIVYGVAATADAERGSRTVASLDGRAWAQLRTAFAADDVASHLRSGTSP